MDKKAIIEALRDKPQLGRPDIKGIPRRVTDAVNRNIATLLGTPVDAVTNAINLGIAGAGTLGHKLGLVSTPPNVIESPIGGSEWFGQQMEQRGMVSPERNTYNEVMAGLLMPAATTRAAKTLFNAEQQAARNIAAPDTLNTPGFRGQRGAIVWHGSPHKFDKFDASKIGTGEGAQAYGHGLYFAESPDVAKAYQTALTHSDDYVDGQLLDSGIPKHFLARILSDESGNVEAARQSLAVLARPGGAKSVADSAKQALKLLDAGERPIVKTIKPEGALYKVDLPDEAVAKMLDWDKPLSQQPGIRKMLNLEQEGRNVEAIVNSSDGGRMLWRLGQHDNINDALNNITGQKLNQLLRSSSTPAESARVLKQAGIPGIRYLDGGSRGAGAGTSNFVVFPGNENMLRILERNNQPMGLMGVK